MSDRLNDTTRDAMALAVYVRSEFFESFIEFITERGCSALTEEELQTFEDLDSLINESGCTDKEFVAEFYGLLDKAAKDHSTRHVYALAYRLCADLEVDSAEIPTQPAAQNG